MLRLLAMEGRWFKAREFNEITFGDLAPLKGHKLEYVKVKSVFGVRGEYGEKASSMKLLRMVEDGYVERKKEGRAFLYHLTWEGWEFAEHPKVRIPVRRIPWKRFRKPKTIVPERIDPLQEATNLKLDHIEILNLKKTGRDITDLINEGKHQQAADYLISWYLMDKFDESVRKKEKQYQRRKERFKKQTGKDLEIFVEETIESIDRPQPTFRERRVVNLLDGTEYTRLS